MSHMVKGPDNFTRGRRKPRALQKERRAWDKLTDGRQLNTLRN